MKDNYCEKEKKCVLDSNCYIQEGEICDILQKLNLPNCYVKNKDDLIRLRESLIKLAQFEKNDLKSRRSLYFKREFRNILKAASPWLILTTLVVGMACIKMPDRKKLCNVEVVYDSNGYEREELIHNDVEIGEGVFIVYDEFKEYENLYTRDYEIYHFKGLSLEEAKEIVADESNFLYEDQFGEPIETGVEYMNQIIESEKDGYKKIELYAKSDDKYYTEPINKIDLMAGVAFIGMIPSLFFTLVVVAETKDKDEEKLIRTCEDRLSLAKEAIQKTKKLV